MSIKIDMVDVDGEERLTEDIRPNFSEVNLGWRSASGQGLTGPLLVRLQEAGTVRT
jgi:hypothetical protein